MIEKIKKLLDINNLKSLSDVRSIGLIVFAIIVLIVTWSGIKVVQTNYDLQKQISVMKQENDIKKIENSNLSLKNKYLETDQYLELVARKQYNKALPGETMVIVPKAVALANSVEINENKDTNEKINLENDGSKFERNYNSWLEFLFRN